MKSAVLPPDAPAARRTQSGFRIKAEGQSTETSTTVSLTSSERILLEYLRAGTIVSVETIACEILGRGEANAGNQNAAQKFVSRLRAKLNAQGGTIQSIYGKGYCWSDAVDDRSNG
jgi:DNA-binding response OmpR family regulator